MLKLPARRRFTRCALPAFVAASALWGSARTHADPVPRAPSLLEGTVSPSKRYGVAWDWPGKKTTDWARIGSGDSNYEKSRGDLGEENADNFLLRLSDGKTLGKISGMHDWNTGESSLNHSYFAMHWSPDERIAVAAWDRKWTWREVTLVRLGAEGVIEKQFRIAAQIERDARNAVRKRFSSAYRRDYASYTAAFSNVRLTQSDTLTTDVTLSVPKQETGTEVITHLTYRVQKNAPPRLVRASIIRRSF